MQKKRRSGSPPTHHVQEMRHKIGATALALCWDDKDDPSDNAAMSEQ